jgi:hypothetical protein
MCVITKLYIYKEHINFEHFGSYTKDTLQFLKWLLDPNLLSFLQASGYCSRLLRGLAFSWKDYSTPNLQTFRNNRVSFTLRTAHAHAIFSRKTKLLNLVWNKWRLNLQNTLQQTEDSCSEFLCLMYPLLCVFLLARSCVRACSRVRVKVFPIPDVSFLIYLTTF